MHDSFVERTLADLDHAPIIERPGFRDQLLSTLLDQLAGRPVRQRVRHGVLQPRWLRRSGALVAAAIVLVVVFAVLLLGSLSAESIVEAAQRDALAPPPFDAIYAEQLSADLVGGPRLLVVHAQFASDNSWRATTLSEQFGAGGSDFSGAHAGTYEAWNGATLAVYSVEDNTFSTRTSANGFEPLGVLSWSNFPERNCAGGDRLADAVVAGRPAHHVRCGPVEVWVDRDTGLILKLVAPHETAYVTSIHTHVTFPPGIFSVTPPPGARVAAPSIDPLPTNLVVGAVAPDWAGTTTGGGHFRLSGLRGRPVLVLLSVAACSDPACAVLPQFDAAQRDVGNKVAFVFVDLSGSSSARQVSAAGYHFTVIGDSGTIMQAWGVQAFPTYVLLRADGEVQAMRVRPQSLADLLAMLGG
jgi:AhpC/TSA family